MGKSAKQLRKIKNVRKKNKEKKESQLPPLPEEILLPARFMLLWLDLLKLIDSHSSQAPYYTVSMYISLLDSRSVQQRLCYKVGGGYGQGLRRPMNFNCSNLILAGFVVVFFPKLGFSGP